MKVTFFECRCAELAAHEQVTESGQFETVVFELGEHRGEEIFRLPGHGHAIDLLARVAEIQADAALAACGLGPDEREGDTRPC